MSDANKTENPGIKKEEIRLKTRTETPASSSQVGDQFTIDMFFNIEYSL